MIARLSFRGNLGLSALAFGALVGVAGTSMAAEAGRPAVAPTFTKDVAPILQEKCQDCHRKGSMAPMSLLTYQETRPWAKAIRQRVITRQMPPWHIDETVGVQKFKNDMSLSEDQIKTIVEWVDAGAPEGNPKDMPPPKVWPPEDQWKAAEVLGPPDLVIQSEPYTMAAHHQDVWWRPTSNIPLTEPRWVRAVEMRPGTMAGRRITHHAVAYLVQDDPASVAPVGVSDPNLRGRGLLMEWAIGKSYDLYRPNTGKLLLPGSQISWDIHIHAVGEQIRDHVDLAIWLYPKGQEPKYRTYLTAFQAVKQRNMDIPPNSIKEFQNFTVLKQAAQLENFQPHMHLRGKAMEVEAILPDGSTQVVSYVNHFNFNWMTNYIYADDAAPMFPKGTIIKVTAWYDNTRANKFNPDPDQWVGYGDRTVDEMGHAWMNVTYVSDADYQAWLAKHPKKQTASDFRIR
ncbi:MAG TPA: cytochrome c [Bryobacteraceae bacterium]|nr:cytochrome c [Bryobacteraceae bacterium]